MHVLRLKTAVQAKNHCYQSQSKMRCILAVEEDVSELHNIFLAEDLNTKRARCKIEKGEVLKFTIDANDPIGMRALINSILKVIETYQKLK